ncbi:MAG: DNA-binding transcriptional LysR family regulator [Neolewinella sp.]|jgi:DNA-binding transcriptional LysR family regulator
MLILMPVSNQIELRHLRYFLAVAEELHFRKAAERLYISQPGLSRQIKQLEAELGYSLFRRNNRTVALTPAGRYLHTEVSKLLHQLDGALQHARLLHEGMEGRLNFGYVGSAMQNIIPELLVRFRADYPNIKYGLEALDNQQQIDRLLARDIDIGFVRLERIPPELNSHVVFEDTFSLVLPLEHPISAHNFTSLAQLQSEPFILFDPAYSLPYYENVMELFDDAGFSPQVSHRTVHATTIYRLVENGFGLSVVPTSLQMGYQLGVKFIELTNIPQRTTLSAIWRADNENPALENFVRLFS